MGTETLHLTQAYGLDELLQPWIQQETHCTLSSPTDEHLRNFSSSLC